MKKLVIGALVVVLAALAAGLGVFVSKVGSLRAAEFDVLEARLNDAKQFAATEEAPLACDPAALRSANRGKAFFGVTSAAVLVRDAQRDLLLPGDLPATSVHYLREGDAPLRLAKDLVTQVPFSEWKRQLEEQSIWGFGTRSTDLFVTVLPTDEVLHVEVRSYVSGAPLCRGTLPRPESSEPRALHDAVAEALQLESR